MTVDMSPEAARATLQWLLEMGCDEALDPTPINRFDLPDKMPAPRPQAQAQAQAENAQPGPMAAPTQDPVAIAEQLAKGAQTLDALRAALASYPHCDLRLGAKSLVFSDGRPGARTMIIGEAPGRDEDRQGKPFVGQAGQLLDRMLAAIGMARDHGDAGRAVYITNVLPWRPPSNRDPEPAEVAMMLPFLKRHVDLANPDLLILMGNHACNAVLGRKGITKLRGHWAEGLGRPVLPMLHPAYLLRQPHAKRDTWADLLTLANRLAL